MLFAAAFVFGKKRRCRLKCRTQIDHYLIVVEIGGVVVIR
jgi:hypothetical protein